MSSRLRVCLLTVLVAVFALTSSSFALEKTASRLTDADHDGDWRGSSTCSIVYYNYCTGWIWNWSGWSPNDVFGVAFDSCCPGGSSTAIEASWIYFSSGSPSGYGFTGNVDVYDADATGCPTGASLATQPLLPATGWNQVTFASVNVPDGSFALTFWVGAGMANPVTIASDHPAAGPTGPAACGSCYPTTRTNHSFYYGTLASPLCPGSALNDGICDAQLMWDAQVSCATAVDQSNWGQIKGLYR
jgi:hypothetical protein